MSKLTRFTQKIFGSSAGVNQIATFGSLAAGSPAYTTDPAIIQSLSNYLTGWFGGILGANSPAIEDMNALCFLFARQLAYLMQAGVPEYDSGTTYYIGSWVQVSGVCYVSLTDTNIGNAVSDVTKWGPPITKAMLQRRSTTTSTTVYQFYLTGVTDGAAVGSVFTNNGQTFTVLQVRNEILGIPNYMLASGTGAPSASGTLTKSSGTGDATMTFSASTTVQLFPAGGIALSSSTGFGWTTALATPIQVTNLQVALTTTGNPVRLELVAAADSGSISTYNLGAGNYCGSVNIAYHRNNSDPIKTITSIVPQSAINLVHTAPVGAFSTIDVEVASGVNQFSVFSYSINSSYTTQINNLKLIAYEL